MNILLLLKNEGLKLIKKTRAWLGPILIFILIMVAFPLTVELTSNNLSDAFYPVLFISILLVMMLATEGIFLEDYDDGTLELFLISKKLTISMGVPKNIYALVAHRRSDIFFRSLF